MPRIASFVTISALAIAVATLWPASQPLSAPKSNSGGAATQYKSNTVTVKSGQGNNRNTSTTTGNKNPVARTITVSPNNNAASGRFP
jgi:hypothetical protein